MFQNRLKSVFFNGKRSNFQYYVSQWLPASILIGISSGALMTFFLFLLQEMWAISAASWAPITIILAGGLTALMSKHGYKEVEGSGLSAIITTKNKEEPLKERSIVTKFIASVTSLGARMPGGEEGPSIFLGGALSYLICKHILRMKDEDVYRSVLIGGGACLATVLGAPLGGTLYAEEVPYKRDIESDIYIPSFVASIIAVLFFIIIGHGIFGVQPFLPPINSSEPMALSPTNILLISTLGVVIGLIGLSYSFIFIKILYFLRQRIETWHRIIMSSVIVAIVVAIGLTIFNAPIAEPGIQLLAWVQTNETYLVNHQQVLIGLVLIKMLLLLILLVGGTSVGIFTPTLALGALIGGFFAIIIGQPFYIQDFIIIGMASMISATSKTPITALVLVLEISSLPNLIVPMALAIVLAYLVSGDWSLKPNQFATRRDALKQKFDSKEYLKMIPVITIAHKEFKYLSTNQTINECFTIVDRTQKVIIPVVYPNSKKLAGTIIPSEIAILNIDRNRKVEDFLLKKHTVLHEHDNLLDAIDKAIDCDDDRFVIVNTENEVVGILTFQDIIRAYRKQEKIEQYLSKVDDISE